MLLSALYEQIRDLDDALLDSSIYLAAPDSQPGDNVDIYVVSIADVRVDHDNNEITLIPVSETELADPSNPILSLRLLLELMPPDTQLGGRFELKVELPLISDPSTPALKSIERIAEFHIGPLSEEAWLLVRPRSEFSPDSLPT
jgi:hypothetical protein